MTALKLKYPIVLIHGLAAKGNFGPIDYFYGIPKYLRQLGNTVYVVNLSVLQTTEQRALELEKLLLGFAEKHLKLNLIAHSFGGIDARVVAHKPSLADKIASVTTIGTPHRGTTLVDLALNFISRRHIDRLSPLFGLFQANALAYTQISSDHTQDIINSNFTDHPNTAYFSATTIIKKPVMLNALPLFWLPHQIIYKVEGDNDGFVSETSAKWGEHIITEYGDHYSQIGHFFGFARGLNHFKFFEKIIGHLKKAGF